MDGTMGSHQASPEILASISVIPKKRKNPRPLPAFHHVNFYHGNKLLFRKPVNNMNKPKISLKIGSSAAVFNPPSVATPAAGTPTPGGSNKIRLTFGGAAKTPTINAASQTKLITHNEPQPMKTKVGRAPKPSAKIIANKKRPADDSDAENGAHASGTITVDPTSKAKAHPTKKIKFSISSNAPRTPVVVKAKFKGKPPKRPLGDGYDSEASDREEDPVIEEEWILRMMPGEDCEYLRTMISERKIGIPKSMGGADVSFKFFHAEGRRAAITVRGTCYAATMVDLPCIIEGMKSWDKKGWYKSADICQMLLVFAVIKKDTDAETIELPKYIDPNTFQHPHGLTAPMRNARKNRFRKRIRREAIEAVEEAVEKLLAADADAASTRYEMMEPEAPSRHASFSSPAPYGQEEEYSVDEDADAEGEDDDVGGYFDPSNASMPDPAFDDMDLEAELEREMMEAETPSSQAVADTPMILNGADAMIKEEEYSGDESVEDDDDAEGESDEEMDEDDRARNAELAGAREDIAEMERQLETLHNQFQAQSNPILKTRVKNNIEKVKAELQLKKSAIGEGDED